MLLLTQQDSYLDSYMIVLSPWTQREKHERDLVNNMLPLNTSGNTDVCQAVIFLIWKSQFEQCERHITEVNLKTFFISLFFF